MVHDTPDIHGLSSQTQETTPTHSRQSTAPFAFKPPRSPTKSPHSTPSPQLHGPRSPPSRDRPGSSRTHYYAPRPAHPPSPNLSRKGPLGFDIHSPPPSAPSTLVDIDEPSTLGQDADAPHAPYRPPEAVYEPPEEHPPGYVPGVVAEHIGQDDDETVVMWDSVAGPSRPMKPAEANLQNDMWIEDVQSSDSPPAAEFPTLGPGILPRRWLQLAHEHELVQPIIDDLPRSASKRLSQSNPSPMPDLIKLSDEPVSASEQPSTSATPAEAEHSHVSTLEEVWDALPGGLSNHHEYYFCTTCWGWLRIRFGRAFNQPIAEMEDWSQTIDKDEKLPGRDTFQDRHSARVQQVSSLRSLIEYKAMAEPAEKHHHLHEYDDLLTPSRQPLRIERVPVEERMNAFPHVTFGMELEKSWDQVCTPAKQAKLYISCSSDIWLSVDDGPFPGQIPRGRVGAFTAEKVNNPQPGADIHEGVNRAWSLIITLLENPLFKNQRGWVKLENKRFQTSIGANISSSVLLQAIGFACREEPEGTRIGPFLKGENTTEDDVKQMDKYMIRTWVETSLYLRAFQKRNDLLPAQPLSVGAISLEDVMGDRLSLGRYPKAHSPIVDSVREDLDILGLSRWDVSDTIKTGYHLQSRDDAKHIPNYLGALEHICGTPLPGREDLQFYVAMERSMDRYTSDDLRAAYSRIGYDDYHVREVAIEPHEAPDDYILRLHKSAVQAANTASERSDLAAALKLIGRHRGSSEMEGLGSAGKTFMSVDDAYAALSAPRDCIDDGLIMQYEMAVNEYPGKLEHYRKCLSIIAEAPGEERPSIRSFLETGNKDFSGPARNDIPVGLQNIGNTCYLNSILQYLYSIRPVREAVMSFEQDLLGITTPHKPEVERSRRFVRHLRLLFMQLYESRVSAVRPEEELAYLAITRPEVDRIIESPVDEKPEPLSSIPDLLPSPSSTKVASPSLSSEPEDESLPASPQLTPTKAREASILGKRPSADRDSDQSSMNDHTRLKSDDWEMVRDAESPMRIDSPAVPEVSPKAQSMDVRLEKGASLSMTAGIGNLDLQSPTDEAANPIVSSPIKHVSLPAPLPAEQEQPAGLVPPPLPPRPLQRRESTLASGLRFGLQQDSAEVLINVLSQLELAFEPTVAEGESPRFNLIRDLFSCKYRQQIVLQDASGQREAQTPVESVFVHPIIGVEEEGKDLSDCLAELYLGGSEIEYGGKKGVMMDLMDHFPPMLYIQMRRSQYDPATGRERKTNTHIPFGQTLSMDRYLATADGSKRDSSVELTQRAMKVRARLHQLKKNKPLPVADTFRHVKNALGQLPDADEFGVDSDFLQALEIEASEVELEVHRLEEELPQIRRQLEELWTGADEWEYELVSVFMHRGKTSGAGHYWTYQAHLPDHSEQFFKYNDEQVTQVPASEVLQDRTGSDANPALLCYVRKGRNLVDTLHRAVLDEERELLTL